MRHKRNKFISIFKIKKIQGSVESLAKHWVMVLLGMVLTILGIYHLIIKPKSEKTIESTYLETQNIKEELLALKKILSDSSFYELSSADYPGVTMVIVADIRKNTNPGDAYILDVLSKNSKERFSVYQTIYNELCFVVKDSNSESEELKIQQSIDGYHNNRVKLYAFDYRETENSSFIRIIVNNKEAGKLNINRKLGLQDALDFKNGTIGATYNELGCSDLLVGMSLVTESGFSYKGLIDIQNIFWEYLSRIGYNMREVGCKGVIHLEKELDWKHPSRNE
jgi:hypothetical protein